MCDDDDAVRTIAVTLFDYIARHPDAADSLEGIRRWWLPGHTAVCAAAVEAALERLVREGELTRQPLPGGGALYARRRAGMPRLR